MNARILTLALFLAAAPVAGAADNLIRNPGFEEKDPGSQSALGFELKGDAALERAGLAFENTSMGVSLHAGRDLDGDSKHEGEVSQTVKLDRAKELPGRWYRFQVRGLPDEGFHLSGDDLHLKVAFFARGGASSYDAVSRKIYGRIEQERRDLAVNGVGKRAGAATWKTYELEFKVPFAEIDELKVSAGFRGGAGKASGAEAFRVDDLSLTTIPAPGAANIVRALTAKAPVDPSRLTALGGRWFYQTPEGQSLKRPLVVNKDNADRLFYRETSKRYVNPFLENMSAWLRPGYLDVEGNMVEADRFVPDSVTLEFDEGVVRVHARNIPNHPTAKFPSPRGSGDRNPSYIQEHDDVYSLPLDPQPDPDAKAMTEGNENRALPMGPVGLAVNGVVFYNPFDAGMQDATDLMDRCCGHPSPDNRYHYHKYPICVKSPFVDEGKEHSSVIGWSFDGFPVYGPYESSGLMAKDDKANPLNDFNIHKDDERGWHYHVTPGKFPYIIGGYWGRRVFANRPGGGRGGMAGRGGPDGPGQGQGFGPPPRHPLMSALDLDGDGELSAEEVAKAAKSLEALDRDKDGQITPDEIPRPVGPPR